MAFGMGARIRAEKRGLKEEEARALAMSRMAEIESEGKFALRAIEKTAEESARLSTARPVSTARPAPEVPYLPESREKGRLGDIMRASPEELRGIYERMPTEERPIHTIRGTEQAYWSPGTRREYGSLRTAMTGFRPQTTAARLEEAEAEKTRYGTEFERGVRGTVEDILGQKKKMGAAIVRGEELGLREALREERLRDEAEAEATKLLDIEEEEESIVPARPIRRAKPFAKKVLGFTLPGLGTSWLRDLFKRDKGEEEYAYPGAR